MKIDKIFYFLRITLGFRCSFIIIFLLQNYYPFITKRQMFISQSKNLFAKTILFFVMCAHIRNSLAAIFRNQWINPHYTFALENWSRMVEILSNEPHKSVLNIGTLLLMKCAACAIARNLAVPFSISKLWR